MTPGPTPMLRRRHMHHHARWVTFAAALLIVAAPVIAGQSREHGASGFEALLAASAPGSNVACANDSYGNTACTIDGKTVDMGDCTSNMSFGAIADAKGATLDDRFPGTGAKPVAQLGEHQLVCLQATVREHGRLVRALVKAVPTASVRYCKGNDICTGADRPVKWITPASGKACTLAANGSYVGDCATGWVDGDAIEEYSMGLKPEDTGA